jgi:tetratricopeptide (TPR) repeat protein
MVIKNSTKINEACPASSLDGLSLFKEGPMKKTFMKYLFALTAVFLCLLSARADAAADGFIIDIFGANIVYTPKDNSVELTGAGLPLAARSDWEVRVLLPDVFRLKHKRWAGFFWEVDATRRSVYEVRGKTLYEDGERKELAGIFVDACGKAAPEKVYLRFLRTRLRYSADIGGVLIETRSNVISYKEDWEVKEPKPGVYHFRNKTWKDASFMELDTTLPMVFLQKVSGGAFGSMEGGTRTRIISGFSSEAPYNRITGVEGGKIKVPAKYDSPQVAAMAALLAEKEQQEKPFKPNPVPAMQACFNPAAFRNPAPLITPPPGVPSFPNTGNPANGFIIDLFDANIVYTLENNSVELTVSRLPISVKGGWEAKAVKPGIFRLKHKKWDGFFWEVDALQRSVYEVKGKTLLGDGERKELAGIRVDACGEVTAEKVNLRFSRVRFRYNREMGGPVLETRSDVISYKEDWEVKEPKPGAYHFRNSLWKDVFLELDTTVPVVVPKKVSGGAFGSIEGGERGLISSAFGAEAPYSRIVGAEGGKIKSPAKYDSPQVAAMAARLAEQERQEKPLRPNPVPAMQACFYPVGNQASAGKALPFTVPQGMPSSSEDRGFANKPLKRPESVWMESEKSLYRGILKKGSYDVLVVPVQVQGYAFDRANRSLMTRYLSGRIGEVSGLKLPDPTLVSRAFGQRARRFDNKEIYKIADELKVKYLMRAYAGHDLDEKMRLTLLVQTRGKDGVLNENSEVVKLRWKDVPFSDDDPPAESFKGMLDDIISKLPVPKKRKPAVSFFGHEKPGVPAVVSAVFKAKPASPVLSAYYLQFIGLLYPEDVEAEWDDNTEREHLFERSLVALAGVSEKSPDYALLKARAYFYLHSRPAALAALNAPKTPEEKAFRALLDGNLPEMERWTPLIGSSLQRLMSEMEMTGLKSDYGQKPEKKEVERMAKEFPSWKALVLRRLAGKDRWSREPNIRVKKMLDEEFPVPDFSAEDVARGLPMGESLFAADAELSVYRHYRKVLEGQGQRLCCASGSTRPVEMDYLDLLYSTGEANLWKQVRLLISVQGQYNEAKERLDSLEAVYRGNIKFTVFKKVCLEYLKNGAPEAGQAQSLQTAIEELKHDECYWVKGQSPFAECDLSEDYYDHDYPRHFARRNSGVSDRMFSKERTVAVRGTKPQVDIIAANLELALLYTHDDFNALQGYHSWLVLTGKTGEADALLEANKDRFVGHPGRAAYLSTVLEKKGKAQDAARLYEKAIAESPAVWPPYKKLGNMYLEDGKIGKAFDVYRKYPLFADPGTDGELMSNIAFDTGMTFLSVGAEKEARHFFKLSADSGTGSGGEMASATLLAMYDGDYKRAVLNAFQHVRMYPTEGSYVPYAELLHLTGRHDDARSVMSAANLRPDPYNLFPGLIGYRMEGKGEAEYIKTFLPENSPRPDRPHYVESYLMAGIFLDRAPDRKLIEAIRGVERRFYPDDTYLTLSEDGYYLLKTKDYGKAYLAFEEQFRKNTDAGVLPYMAMSGIKAGLSAEVREKLEALKKKTNGDVWFSQYLADALVSGSNNDVDGAVRYLDLARCNIGTVWSFPYMPWHTLVEAAEWLYEDTGNDRYRELAIEYAKMHQRILPMMAWAYAVEAKYSQSGPDRLRALALTLYLDRRSERISKFSEKERQEAMKWLDKNNPFLESREKGPASFEKTKNTGRSL